ncbi:hypothetical protein, partial [Idiomarina baltica]
PIAQLTFPDCYEAYRLIVVNGLGGLAPLEEKIRDIRQLRQLSTQARGLNIAIILQNHWLTWTQEYATDPTAELYL